MADADVPMESCFNDQLVRRLQPGNNQVGEFLWRPDSRYERECGELLMEEIRTLKPQVILLPGPPMGTMPWLRASSFVRRP